MTFTEKVRIALFAKMNVPAVTSLATQGIYYQQAPEGTSRPYVIFADSPTLDIWAFNNEFLLEGDDWLIKAVVDEDSSTTKEPNTLANEILQAIENTVGHSLALTGAQAVDVRRTRRMPPRIEQSADKPIYHRGFFLKVVSKAV